MSDGIDVAVSDQSELRALREWMGSQVKVVQQAGVPAQGEQGVLDYLTVIGSSGVLVAAIQLIPEFLRSRRKPVTVKITVKGQDIAITADNAKDVLPVVERLIDAG